MREISIERNFPVVQINRLARRESQTRQFYRPVYSVHRWWARRLGSVFRAIILSVFSEEDEDVWARFFRPNNLGGKVVLDPFMGGGTTIVEALRVGCKVIGVDLNPVAWWVVKKQIEPVDPEELDRAFEELQKNVAPRIKAYYKTTCPTCAGGYDAGRPKTGGKGGSPREVDVIYVFWVREIDCVGCGAPVPLHKSFRIARAQRNNPEVLFCPGCGFVFEVRDRRPEVACPACSREFEPDRGTARGNYYVCPTCGQKGITLHAVRRSDSPPAVRMFALEYHCPVHGRGYKAPGTRDRELYFQASAELKARLDEREVFGKQGPEGGNGALVYPEQAIPAGEKTDALLSYNYRYWHQMFNDRQLLCLNLLLEGLTRIRDPGVADLFLTLFSECLDSNNMFCDYDSGYRKLTNMFGFHAFPVSKTPVENNLWGAAVGARTFSSYYKKLRRAKQYCLLPFEKAPRDGEDPVVVTMPGEKIDGRLARDFKELSAPARNGEGAPNALLLCQTSEEIDAIPDASVDAVITDPPYFDNVMYAELADFYYVWLRLFLRRRYPHFFPEETPKVAEIVKSSRRGKDAGFFLEGLTRVFSECRRVLRPGGVLAFTFHHREPQAWSAVLKSVLDAGFWVSAVFPVHAEMKTSVHIRGLESIEYDAVIICRPRSAREEIAWEYLEDRIYFAALSALEDLRRSGLQGLSRGDLAVILLGKCLEGFSRHYPLVFAGTEQVGVEAAIEKAWGIVETLMSGREIGAGGEIGRGFLEGLDRLSLCFVLHLAGRREVGYSELNKILRTAGVETGRLKEALLLREKGGGRQKGVLEVVAPADRWPVLERLLSTGRLTACIDRAHYLKVLYERGRDVRPTAEKWRDGTLKQFLCHLARATADEDYAKVAHLLE